MKTKLLIAFSFLFTFAAKSQTIINTVVGDGTIGNIGDNAQADSAKLNQPTAFAKDALGNLYIAEYAGNRIRKVNTAGIITTIAGNGTASFSGDGGQATAATINTPWAIAVDANNNLYIADNANNRIRKVNTAGIISTIAGTGASGFGGDGGAATAAMLSGPASVVVDTVGNIYISDFFNNRIRKINSLGIISTAAGTSAGFSGDGGPATSAKIYHPAGLTFDTQNNLYISDAGNNRIRKVNSSGLISTFAGTGAPGYSGDGAQATAATLSGPVSVSVDNSNNLFITDGNNLVIRKIDNTGIITTVAGDQAKGIGFSGDGGQAVLAQFNYPYATIFNSVGDLLIADLNNNRVRKVNSAGIITTYIGNINTMVGDGNQATLAQLWAPQSLVFDAAGNMYIADNSNNRIRKVNTAGLISTVAGNGTTGFTGDGGPATAATLNGPASIAIDAGGNLYIADSYNHAVRKVDNTGIITTLAGNGTPGFLGDGGASTAAQLHFPLGVGVDKTGNVYISDSYNECIRKIDNGGIITTVIGNGTGGFSGDGGSATAAKINLPMGIAFDTTGNLYFADSNNQRIRKLSSAGVISTVVGYTSLGGFGGDGGLATSARLYWPSSICFDASNKMYIADANNNRIREVDNSGIIHTIAGTGVSGFSGDGGTATLAKLSNPQGVAVNATGNLYIADMMNNRIRSLTFATAIAQFTNNNKITIYPNPTTDKITISTTNLPNTKYTAYIYNFEGKQVMMSELSETQNTLQVNQLAAGSYLLSLQKNGSPYGYQIFIKQ